MLIETMVRHSAPTLAGIKVGNLFSYRFANREEFINDIKIRNNMLNSKGIFVKILKINEDFALVYVFRKNKLIQTLKRNEIREFLKERGYISMEINEIFKNLQKNLLESEFPHEIGVFLGYPLSDIKSFIEDRGANAKYVGCWIAYTNENNAKKISERYKKCTKVFCKRFAQGTDITRLTIAC